MSAVRSRRCKLAQLVADHVLGDEYRNVLPAIVHRKRVTDHVGNDRRAPAPRLDQFLLIAGIQIRDLLKKMVIDEEPLF